MLNRQRNAIIFVYLLLILSIVPIINQEILTDKVKAAENGVVKVKVKIKGYVDFTTGTGFAISRNYIITSYHVISDLNTSDIFIISGDSEPQKADIVEYDIEKDVAVLRINSELET